LEILDALSKTELVGKMKQILKAIPEMEQRQAATILREKTSISAEKTQESEKSDLLVISKDKQEEEEKKKYKKGKQSSGDGDEEPGEDDKSEHLDLKA
jgi:hypothetical protein